MKAPPRIITIVCHDGGNGDFDIHEGEYLAQHLCWHEFLGSIAVITHPQLGPTKIDLKPTYARLEHIDSLLYGQPKWREMCRPADKEVVGGLIEATGNHEAAIKTRAAEWRKDNDLPVDDDPMFQEVGE